MPGTLSLRLLGASHHTLEHLDFSRMDVSLEPLLQSGSFFPPLLFFSL